MLRPNALTLPLLVLGLLGLFLHSAALAQEPDFTGHWEGAIEVPTGALQVLVDLERGEAGWTGTVDIPLQSAKGLALEGIAVEGSHVRFTIVGVPGTPTFDGTLADGEITGTFTQGMASLPFKLGREAVEVPTRPQEPKPPFPYRAEEVTYTNGDVRLAATLTLPAGEGPFPGVVLITGSGSQNRDEELMGHKPFLVLADHLTRAGVAVLRADDRGVDGSTGDLAASTLDELADDALAGLALLRARPEVDGSRVGLLGHSEGGLVAPLAASRSQDVAFVVTLAGPGVPLEQILRKQNELLTGGPEPANERVAEVLALMEQAFPLLRGDADEETVRKGIEEIARKQMAIQREAAGEAAPSPEEAEEQIAQAAKAFSSRLFRDALRKEPREILARVKVPVLALNGSLDLQVDAEQNLPTLEAALRETGNEDVTAKRLDGLNHLFQTATTGSPLEYSSIEETMAPRALEEVSSWILERFGPAEKAQSKEEETEKAAP